MDSVFHKLKRTVSFLTIDQWQAIDAEYKTNNPFELKGVSVFICIAAVLIILEYFCRSDLSVSFPWLYSIINMQDLPSLWINLFWAISAALNYFLLPAIIIKFILREKILDYGFRLKRKPYFLLIYAALFLIVIPFVYAVSFSPAFLSRYPFYKYAADSFFELFSWEAGYGLQFAALEFFFRGFILFSLARYFGSYAIFMMTVPYVMIHFAKPLPETIGAIITGITLGTLALRTRSIYGGIIIHTAVAWSMDLLALFHKGELQKLFR